MRSLINSNYASVIFIIKTVSGTFALPLVIDWIKLAGEGIEMVCVLRAFCVLCYLLLFDSVWCQEVSVL